MAKSQKICDLKLVLFRESEKAFLVGLTEARDEAVWLPASQVEKGDQCGSTRGLPIHEFQVPEWLAIDKELV